MYRYHLHHHHGIIASKHRTSPPPSPLPCKRASARFPFRVSCRHTRSPTHRCACQRVEHSQKYKKKKKRRHNYGTVFTSIVFPRYRRGCRLVLTPEMPREFRMRFVYVYMHMLSMHWICACARFESRSKYLIPAPLHQLCCCCLCANIQR